MTNGNTAIPVSPVGETEMREFFERVVSSVVAMSEQARKLEEMRETIFRLNDRLDALEADRNHLRSVSEAKDNDIGRLTELVERQRAEIQDLTHQSDNGSQALAEHKERLNVAQSDLSVAQEAHVQARRDADDAKREAEAIREDYKRTLEELKATQHELDTVNLSRDDLKRDRDEWRGAAQNALAKLEHIQRLINGQVAIAA